MLKVLISLSAVLICVTAVLSGPGVSAESAYGAQNQSRGIRVLPVQGNIYMVSGGGSNIAASVGAHGVMLVDTGRAEMADQVIAAVEQLAISLLAPLHAFSPCVGIRCPGKPGSGSHDQWGQTATSIYEWTGSPTPIKPLRYIINTSIDPEHMGGNARIAPKGRTFAGGEMAGSGGGDNTDRPELVLGIVPDDRKEILGEFFVPGNTGEGAEIWAHEAVAARMRDGGIPESAHPNYTYRTEKRKWDGFFNGESIELHHIPAAHTDGDTIVYFRYSDVIATGDVLRLDTYPVIDLEKGGSFQGMLDGVHKILDIAIPQFRGQGGTYIVPGHGYIADTGDVIAYRNMMVKVRDRLQDMIGKGMTLEQVKAARPTLDYDGRYGSPDRFIEAAYRTLSRRQ
jgi:glyoxylase-like metal-dependent hydrolase (beta-lactamase superfamily II)